MERYFVVGPHHSPHISFQSDLYGLYRRKAAEFAKSIDRELAEGPVLLVLDNYFGPVELWPLVMEVG